MNTIELKIVKTTPNGSKHVQLLINRDDCGVLYLTPTEHDLVISILRAARNSEVIEYYESVDE